MYETLHGMTPHYLRSRFVYRDDISAYRLRNTENKLVLTQPRTDFYVREVFRSAELCCGTTYHRPKTSIFNDRLKSKLSRHSFT